MKDKIVPLLRRQRGFQDEIIFVTGKRNQVIAISFWDDQRSAEQYNHIAYLDLLRGLSSVVEVLPIVETFEDIESTLHRPAAIFGAQPTQECPTR
jgi:hypothetical protein